MTKGSGYGLQQWWLRDNFPNFQKKHLDKIFKIFVDEIKNSLKRGDSVEIRSFGRFSVKIHKDKISRNPKTGERIKIPQTYF